MIRARKIKIRLLAVASSTNPAKVPIWLTIRILLRPYLSECPDQRTGNKLAKGIDRNQRTDNERGGAESLRIEWQQRQYDSQSRGIDPPANERWDQLKNLSVACAGQMVVRRYDAAFTL